MDGHGALAALLLTLAACAAPASRGDEDGPPPPSPPPPLSAAGADGRPAVVDPLPPEGVGSVAGIPLRAEELLEEWHRLAPRETWLVVDKLVATRLALAEASRIGVVLEPELVREHVDLERRRQEAEIRAAADGGSVERFLREELRVDPRRFYGSLQESVVRRLVAERVVRAWTLSRENRAVRVIVVPDDGTIVEVRRRLDAGEDFADLARELSVDETAPDGGYVPYLTSEASSPLARVAFETPVGEVGGPVHTVDHYVLVRVEQARRPLAGGWETVGPEVEATLRLDPVRDSEFLVWKLSAERRLPVDLRPLEKLLGTP